MTCSTRTARSAGSRPRTSTSYGRIKAKTRPTVGNHEYGTSGASGYFTLLRRRGRAVGKGYYSYDVGNTWHVVTLNSNCDVVSCATGSAQEQWLRADLAATTRPCVIATWHHPRFSSGYSNTPRRARSGPRCRTTARSSTSSVTSTATSGSTRSCPTATANANGIQEIVVGTGGRSLDGCKTPLPNSAVRLSAFGVLKLALGDNTYSWQFVDQNGTVRDSGTRDCHWSGRASAGGLGRAGDGSVRPASHVTASGGSISATRRS